MVIKKRYCVFIYNIKIAVKKISLGGALMVKTTLPVILLRGVVLLPYSEIRLEVNNDIDREIFKLVFDSVHEALRKSLSVSSGADRCG
jgi:hypothetical protein